MLFLPIFTTENILVLLPICYQFIGLQKCKKSCCRWVFVGFKSFINPRNRTLVDMYEKASSVYFVTAILSKILRSKT